MADEAPTPFKPGFSAGWTTTLTIAGTVVGMCVGGVSMWFTVKDRFEKEIENRVTVKITTEGRLVRIEEKLEALRGTVWTMQTQPPQQQAAPAQK